MTVSTPDQAAILAAASFEAMPAAAHGAARPPGHHLQAVVDLDHLLDERGLVGGAGVGGEESGRVGEQDQEVGRHQVGHQRGQPVVVAEADLVVRGGVVLVHHRDHTELEEPGQGLAGVQVLLAVDEVEGGEQDLTRRPGRGRPGRRRRPASAGAGPRPTRPAGWPGRSAAGPRSAPPIRRRWLRSSPGPRCARPPAPGRCRRSASRWRRRRHPRRRPSPTTIRSWPRRSGAAPGRGSVAGRRPS